MPDEAKKPLALIDSDERFRVILGWISSKPVYQPYWARLQKRNALKNAMSCIKLRLKRDTITIQRVEDIPSNETQCEYSWTPGMTFDKLTVAEIKVSVASAEEINKVLTQQAPAEVNSE